MNSDTAATDAVVPDAGQAAAAGQSTRDAASPAGPGAPSAAGAGRPRGINWFRFWMQMLAAMVVFNIIAGLVTWYYIFPRLHPAH
jgi:hypothetical protein